MMVRLLFFCLFVTVSAKAQYIVGDLIVPEQTNYEKTSTYADVISFLDKQVARSKNIRLISMGKSPEGKDIPVAILAHPMVNSADEAKSGGKLIIYIQGNIHAGEVEGKEAVMQEIRNLLAVENNPVFEKLIILFAPIYNTDSNDKMAFGRRPSQDNSPPEVGIRENSQGLDLNRDGMKMETPETNGLFSIVNEWDPQLFVDLHTTNGTWHGWDLTWAPSYHYAGEKGPYDFTITMLKDITKTVSEKYSLDFGPYGDYDLRTDTWPATKFYTYNHHPRYLVNQFGLRNRMAILSEAFSHEPFKKRVYSTLDFVTEIIDYAAGHASEIKEINKQAEQNTIKNAGSLNAKGVRFRMVPSEVLHNMPTYRYQYDSTRKSYQHLSYETTIDNVTYYGGFEAEVTSTVPEGYVIPKELKTIVDNLKKHGIKVDELKKSTKFSGDVFQVDRYETAQKKFEGHAMARATGKFVTSAKKFKKGDFLVPLAQPLGNLAFYLLEPESDDGLVAWNFFDESLQKQKTQNNPLTYPVFRYYKNK